MSNDKLLRIVQDWITQGGTHTQRAWDAFDTLVDRRAKRQLRWIVDNWTAVGGNRGQAAHIAFDALSERW